MMTPTPVNAPIPHAEGLTRLGAISFINTLPIYYAFTQNQPHHISLVYDTPARLNNAMGAGQLDISPVSSAYYLQHQDDLVLLDDLSVSSHGAVESVLFLSKTPLGPALLDHGQIAVPDDSATSILLLAHLIKQYTGEDLSSWFKTYPAGAYQQALDQTGCALVIGDHALKLSLQDRHTRYAAYHCYDLSTLWGDLTHLPFVFAVWVARRDWAEKNPAHLKTINQQLIASRDTFFNDSALQQNAIQQAAAQCPLSAEQITRYFKQCLNYRREATHTASLILFDQAIQPFLSQSQEVTS